MGKGIHIYYFILFNGPGVRFRAFEGKRRIEMCDMQRMVGCFLATWQFMVTQDVLLLDKM